MFTNEKLPNKKNIVYKESKKKQKKNGNAQKDFKTTKSNKNKKYENNDQNILQTLEKKSIIILKKSCKIRKLVLSYSLVVMSNAALDRRQEVIIFVVCFKYLQLKKFTFTQMKIWKWDFLWINLNFCNFRVFNFLIFDFTKKDCEIKLHKNTKSWPLFRYWNMIVNSTEMETGYEFPLLKWSTRNHVINFAYKVIGGVEVELWELLGVIDWIRIKF